MTILERIKSAQTTASLIVATFLIVPFHIIIFYLFWYVSLNFVTLQPNLTIELIPVGIGYFALGILYCTWVSNKVFHPKRIVSPINLQIGTAIVMSILLIYNETSAFRFLSQSQILSNIGTLSNVVIYLMAILLGVGAAQFWVVRELVGRNLINTDRKSYTIDVDYQTVDKVLAPFFSRFKREPEFDKKIVYRTSKVLVDQIVLVLGADAKNPHNSILASVAYRKGVYSIEKSEIASDRRDVFYHEINSRLLTNDPSYEITEIEQSEPNDPVSAYANSIACEPAISKIEMAGAFFEKVTLFWRVLIVCTVVPLVIINAIFWGYSGIIKPSDYLSSMVILLVAILVEIAIPLREEVFLKKVKTG